MKKFLAVILSVCLLFCFTSCKKADNTSSDLYEITSEYYEVKEQNKKEDSSNKESKEAKKTTDETVATEEDLSNCEMGLHRYAAATCTKPATCVYCKVTDGEPMGHTFLNGSAVCINCGAHGDNWVDFFTENDYEITEKEVDEILNAAYRKPKNVIVMIGDGMGPNDIILTEKYGSQKYSFGLILNKIDNTGFATTYSANSEITDSAAAGTALATGTKTNNGFLGISPDGKILTNMSEIARKCGKKVGIVTNDAVIGATPSAYTVHNSKRTDGQKIAKSFVEFAPDVLIGQQSSDFGKCDLSKFAVSYSLDDINEGINCDLNNTKPYFGFFDEDCTAKVTGTLAHYTEAALNRLKNDNGFFLMVENAGTDFAGHSNNINGKLNGVINLDRAVAVVLKFMKENPDTLLIITSDHECGGVKLPENHEPLTKSLFTTTGHTATNVRTFAVGYGAEYFKGTTVDNTDIAKFTMKAIEGNW